MPLSMEVRRSEMHANKERNKKKFLSQKANVRMRRRQQQQHRRIRRVRSFV
jgi:hypothetical protein